VRDVAPFDSPLARIHLVPVEDMPEGPAVTLDRPDSSRTIVERLRDPRPGDQYGILIRVGTLNSPDRITPLGVGVQGRRIEVQVEVRRYQGPLFANLPAVAVLELGPVSLVPGPGEVQLTIHSLPFDVIDRPDLTGPPSVSTKILTFSVPP
jgi:hypothetical protein